MENLTLRVVTEENLEELIRLTPTLHDGQDRFVASNVFSVAEAFVSTGEILDGELVLGLSLSDGLAPG